MVPHTKSNARSRAARSSVADGGAGTTCVGTPAASPICRPIMLCGSMSEQPATKNGVRYEIINCVRYEFRQTEVDDRERLCVGRSCRDFIETSFLDCPCI